MKQYILVLIGLSILGFGFAETNHAAQDAGTDSALYLGTGARAIAMGRAGVTESESAFTADWNPGGLGFIPQCAVAVQHASLFGDALHESIGFVYPSLDWGVVALTLSRLEVGDIERRNEHNLPTGNFGMVEQQANLAYGYPVWGPFSAGASLRIHDLRLDGLVSTAPGMDAGIFFKLPVENDILKEVRSGFSCRNALSPVIKLKDEGDQLFPTWRLGGSAKIELVPDFPDRLLIRVEAEKPERADIRWHAGLEYTIYNVVSLRGGWDHEYFSAGVGVAYWDITLNYAVSFPTIGMRHLMTLSYAIGQSVSALRAKREAEAERERQKIIENMKNKIIADYKKQANALTQDHKFKEAAKLWEKILDWEPENSQAKAQLDHVQKEIIRIENARNLKAAHDYMRKKHYIDVMVECQMVLERDPENAIAKSLYTQAEKKAQRLGKFSLTTNMQMLERIRQEYQLGLEAYTKRNYIEAVKHWEKVIETTPLQKQVYRYLQNARTRILKAQQAKSRAVKVLTKESKRQKLYKEAVNLSCSGKLKEAVRSWEKLVEENPEDQDARKNLEKTRQNLIESQKKGIRW